MLTACSALALASCGGDEKQVEQRTDTWPTIEQSLANRLADRSDAVAARLDSGDACGAAEEAAQLRAEVTAAIGSIPEVYIEDFSGLVNEIQAQIPPCEHPDDRMEEDEDGKGKGKGKKRKKKNKDHGDDE
ncbi:MAG: hypothetical protein ACRDNH_05395 [Gaiellaceae bacterium]